MESLHDDWAHGDETAPVLQPDYYDLSGWDTSDSSPARSLHIIPPSSSRDLVAYQSDSGLGSSASGQKEEGMQCPNHFFFPLFSLTSAIANGMAICIDRAGLTG